MTITNKTGLFEPLVEVADELYNSHERSKDNEASTTTLQKGFKEAVLQRNHYDEIEQDVQDTVALWAGTAVHAFLEEKARKAECICEITLERSFEHKGKAYIVTGKFDCYDPKTRTLYDYKDCKVASYQKAKEGKDDKWFKQLAVYSEGIENMGFPVDKLVNICMLTDHSKVKASTDQSYPQGAIQQIEYDMKSPEALDRRAEIIEEQTQRMIQFMDYLKIPEDDVPPCTPEERFQEPHYAVFKECATKAMNGGSSFETEEDAKAFIADQSEGTYEIKFRCKEPMKCKLYCSVNRWCNWYQNYLKGESK